MMFLNFVQSVNNNFQGTNPFLKAQPHISVPAQGNWPSACMAKITTLDYS